MNYTHLKRNCLIIRTLFCVIISAIFSKSRVEKVIIQVNVWLFGKDCGLHKHVNSRVGSLRQMLLTFSGIILESGGYYCRCYHQRHCSRLCWSEKWLYLLYLSKREWFGSLLSQFCYFQLLFLCVVRRSTLIFELLYKE